MRCLKAWKYLLKLPGVSKDWLASCAYGSSFKKEFALLGTGLALRSIHRKCPGCAYHTPVQGKNAKLSAVYADGVADAFASLFTALLEIQVPHEPEKRGLESLMVNDILCSSLWKAAPAWSWAERDHINLLETKAFLKVLREQARAGGDVRYPHIVDSAVTLGSVTKGRSSTRTLSSALKRSTALQLSFGLSPATAFGPTRLNIADDPTRDAPLRDACPRSILACLSDLFLLSTFNKLTRSSANWLRLSCLPVGFRCRTPVGVFLRCRTLPFRHTNPLPASAPASAKHPTSSQPCMDFDSTKGYPGEGPPQGGAPRSALQPRTSQDQQRQRLPEGRPVLKKTQENRQALLARFDFWLSQCGSSWVRLREAKPLDPELVNRLLVNYGRQLYEAGRPYWHYSETVNAVGASLPSMRRQLQQTWDLAFSWMSVEPNTHHVPMPPVILLALLSVCLMWGWLPEAALFGLSWGALLRIGEATSAKRADLVLPRP